ncbi:MT-A70-domain-containing protein [Aspergillus pseudotamarii]|uniref:MT-A70-domain-containing protein n=1 Tax=Aspergillus pseudotamarii TaxID=132259 RepID=A0A5N6SLT2_ASPPS|nr:MT-A70-domain-containing protein [Aspergillus pseudotamarii]KAE8134651.1 MT-A70-domain-containing protein [Aspergillus pseudotamarii]
MTRSSILYQNSQNTVFLLDIPTSIALAQDFSPVQQESPSDSSELISSTQVCLRHVLSSTPLKVPYPGSTEPKTDAARAKVLQRIPVSEREIHDAIAPLVREALHEIRLSLGGDEWCFERRTLAPDSGRNCTAHCREGNVSLGKRSRKGLESSGNDDCRFPVEDYTDSTVPGKSTKLRGVPQNPDLVNPPLVLSPGLNLFDSMSGLCNLVVRNTSSDHATVRAGCVLGRHGNSTETNCAQHYNHTYYIPPLSSFLLCKLPISQSATKPNRFIDPIPGLSRDRKFDLILLDPPWVNRSVRRSGHYHTQHYLEGDLLTQCIRDILRVHLQDSHCTFRCGTSDDRISTPKPPEPQTQSSIAAIWITNSAKARRTAYDAIQGAGLSVCEEWIWIKATANGDPITPIDGLWRKPYEVLVIGRMNSPQLPAVSSEKSGGGVVTRRFIAAVPDVHSRKPNLKEIFEKVFFDDASPSPKSEDRTTYSALEVFARNLTAGWWACGDEALKFNSEEWWVHDKDTSLS